LFVTNHKSVTQHSNIPFGKLESEISHKRNPEYQQALIHG
jgi:hypothetical protein